MADKYKFKDRTWNVTHKHSGENIGTIGVMAQDVKEAYNSDKSLRPSTWEDELHDNAVGRLLYNNKLNADDIVVKEVVDKPKKIASKASGGSSCW